MAPESQNRYASDSSQLRHSRGECSSERCCLQWSELSKTVEVHTKSDGLMRFSISHTQTRRRNKNNDARKVIINHASGYANPGEVLAIMGPSGSGKTSLLNILSGRSPYDAGKIVALDGDQRISVNGRKGLAAPLKQLKRRVGYITQEDSLFGHLTVRDQLTYTALLRLPPSLSVDEKHNEVDQLLSRLRLRKCADTQIRLISGGEKKRVNIGTELLSDPLLLLLDEPTTGLDSTSANTLLGMLVELAKEQHKTIITTLHQPSSRIYHVFDKVLFLADGCVVYHGNPSSSIDYLFNLGHRCPRGYNAADHWMDLLVDEDEAEKEGLLDLNAVDEEKSSQAGESQRQIVKCDDRKPTFRKRRSTITTLLDEAFDTIISKNSYRSQLIQEWRNNHAATIGTHVTDVTTLPDKPISKKNRDAVSWSTQLSILTHRSMKNSQSAIFTWINLLRSVLVGLMAGMLWFRLPYTEGTISDRNSYLFFTVQFWIFNSLFAALLSFPTERAVILKERASGSYHLSAYFLSKTISEIPVRLVLPCIYLFISFWMAGANNSFSVFLGILGFIILGVIAGDSIGLVVGASFLDFEHASATLVVITVTLMISTGFYLDNVPDFMMWASYISPFNYAYTGAALLCFDKNIPCDDSDTLFVCGQPGVYFATPYDIYEFLGIDTHVWFNAVMLFVLTIVFRTLAFYVFKYKRDVGRG